MEKLKAMPYAQAHIIRRPNHITLVSYTTRVADIVGGVLIVYGLYSATTRRHIGAFAQQFGADYAIAKNAILIKLAMTWYLVNMWRFKRHCLQNVYN